MYNIAKREDWKLPIISFIIIFALQLFFALKGLFLLGGISFAAYPIISLGCTRKEEWKEIGIKKPERWSPVLVGILASGIIVVLSYIICSFLIGNTTSNYFYVVSLKDVNLFDIQNLNQWGTIILSGVIFSTMPSLTEEIYFRGFLLKHLKERFGFRIANIIQGICFGLIHIPYCWLVVFDINVIWSVVPSVTLVGIIYGWVRNESDSILSTIITHAAANFFIFIIMYSIIIPQIIS